MSAIFQFTDIYRTGWSRDIDYGNAVVNITNRNYICGATNRSDCNTECLIKLSCSIVSYTDDMCKTGWIRDVYYGNAIISSSSNNCIRFAANSSDCYVIWIIKAYGTCCTTVTTWCCINESAVLSRVGRILDVNYFNTVFSITSTNYEIIASKRNGCNSRYMFKTGFTGIIRITTTIPIIIIETPMIYRIGWRRDIYYGNAVVSTTCNSSVWFVIILIVIPDSNCLLYTSDAADE